MKKFLPPKLYRNRLWAESGPWVVVWHPLFWGIYPSQNLWQTICSIPAHHSNSYSLSHLLHLVLLFFPDFELGLIFQKFFVVIFYVTFVCFRSKRWVFPHKFILSFRQKSRYHFHKDSKIMKVSKEVFLNASAWNGAKQNVRVAFQWTPYTLTPAIYPAGT